MSTSSNTLKLPTRKLVINLCAMARHGAPQQGVDQTQAQREAGRDEQSVLPQLMFAVGTWSKRYELPRSESGNIEK